ncbi:MAG TPA: GntR family transcriptional regulator [Polyangiaceae bacterium]|jgi:DNA-binding FadR family transcriptional regulator|nr:GntR family transcriptional regulator [Polyangiaceae bacterium]
MVFRAVKNQSLGDQVFEQVAREILTGRFTPGEQLPSERALVTTFGVNRHVVREALKRIEQLGLVSVTHGGGTVVLDFRKHAGLDLMAVMADNAQADDESMTYWLAVHEMRAAIGADAARLCAIRAPKEVKARLSAIAQRMAELGDGPELFDLEIEFWELVIDGSANLAYRLGFNTLMKGVLAKATIELARSWSIHEVKESGYRGAIARAIAEGNAKQAEAKTRESMNLVVTYLDKRVGPTSELAKKEPPKKKPPAPKRIK